jgi:hypothetical protein
MELNGRGVRLIINLQLTARLKMDGSIPLPTYALVVHTTTTLLIVLRMVTKLVYNCKKQLLALSCLPVRLSA